MKETMVTRGICLRENTTDRGTVAIMSFECLYTSIHFHLSVVSLRARIKGLGCGKLRIMLIKYNWMVYSIGQHFALGEMIIQRTKSYSLRFMKFLGDPPLYETLWTVSDSSPIGMGFRNGLLIMFIVTRKNLH